MEKERNHNSHLQYRPGSFECMCISFGLEQILCTELLFSFLFSRTLCTIGGLPGIICLFRKTVWHLLAQDQPDHRNPICQCGHQSDYRWDPVHHSLDPDPPSAQYRAHAANHRDLDHDGVSLDKAIHFVYKSLLLYRENGHYLWKL